MKNSKICVLKKLIVADHLPCDGYFTSCITYMISLNLYDSFLKGGYYRPSFTDGEAETWRGNFFKIA